MSLARNGGDVCMNSNEGSTVILNHYKKQHGIGADGSTINCIIRYDGYPDPMMDCNYEKNYHKKHYQIVQQESLQDAFQSGIRKISGRKSLIELNPSQKNQSVTRAFSSWIQSYLILTKLSSST
jgi:hypothetical protein